MRKTAWAIACLICMMIGIVGCGKQQENDAAGEKSQIGDSESEAVETEMADILEYIAPIVDQDGADPYVTTYNGKYLYTKTTGGNICIGLADSIQTLGATELICVYDPGVRLTDLWAPEIWYLDDAWYIYFAATIPGESIHRMFVLRNENENPFEGDWAVAMLGGMDNKFAIDGTIMELDGKRYFLWSGWEGNQNVRQDIYLAEMINPWTVMEEKILLSMPEYDWETVGNPLVNEGPEVWMKDDTVNLVYSASGSWTDDYCLGLLTLKMGQDPKLPENWTKSEKPIFSKTESVFGPGHNCFVKSLDGEDLIVYHAARWAGAGWSRGIRFGFVEYETDGSFARMEPVSGTDKIKLPSGEPFVVAYDASSLSKNEDKISLTITSKEDEEAYVVIFARWAHKKEGTLANVKVACGQQSMERGLCGGSDYQPLFYKLGLVAGENELYITCDQDVENLTIQSIEIRH